MRNIGSLNRVKLLAIVVCLTLLAYWTSSHQIIWFTPTAVLDSRALWFTPVISLDNGMKLFGVADGATENYLGIPYAKAPVGDLRWSAPQEYVPTIADKGNFSAKAFGQPCVQPAGPDATAPSEKWIGDEDCLFLNVYVPSNPASSEPLPVALWIHGGSFTTGQGALYPGGALASLRNDVIIVTTNFRLNLFGHLGSKELAETAEDGGTGNYGLLDQRMAMRWVRKNIAAFGGDPSHVSLFGESSGALSISSHLLSDNSAPFFDAAVMQSGAFNAESNIQPMTDAQRTFEIVLDLASCDNVDCLKSLTTDELKAIAGDAARATYAIRPRVYCVNVWCLTADGVDLTGNALTLIGSGKANSRGVPVILGTNQDEGIIFANLVQDPNATLTDLYNQWSETIPLIDDTDIAKLSEIYLKNVTNTYPSFEGDVLAPLYYGNGTLPFWAADRSMGDRLFACSAIHSAQYLAITGPTYAYHFEHASKDTNAVVHGGEVPYVFSDLATFSEGSKFGFNGFDEDDLLVAEKMANMWLNFFVNGDPGDPRWVEVTEGSDNILRIMGADNMTVADTSFKKQECAFWLEHYRKEIASVAY